MVLLVEQIVSPVEHILLVPVSKTAFKKLVKSKVTSFWHKKLTEDAANALKFTIPSP